MHGAPIEIEPIWPDLITHFNKERLGSRQKQQDALCHRTQLQTSTPAKSKGHYEKRRTLFEAGVLRAKERSPALCVYLCERRAVNQRRTGASRRNFGRFPGAWVVYLCVFIARCARRTAYLYLWWTGAQDAETAAGCCCVRTHNNKMGLCALSLRSLNSVHSLLRSNFALPWRPQTGRRPNPCTPRAPSMTPVLGIRVRVLILTPSIQQHHLFHHFTRNALSPRCST